MNFSEWFNYYSEPHLKAFLEFKKYGRWPEGFIPDNVIYNPMELFKAIMGMGELWADERLRPPSAWDYCD